MIASEVIRARLLQFGRERPDFGSEFDDLPIEAAYVAAGGNLDHVQQFLHHAARRARITSYNVCYTKLLRSATETRTPERPPLVAEPGDVACPHPADDLRQLREKQRHERAASPEVPWTRRSGTPAPAPLLTVADRNNFV